MEQITVIYTAVTQSELKNKEKLHSEKVHSRLSVPDAGVVGALALISPHTVRGSR